MSAGNDYGYFANPSKSWLLVKPNVLVTTKLLFANTNINMTSNGCRYLGSPIGSHQFVSEYIFNTMSEWVN
uniref:Reverse transcriptase domain-containing protein n=1 Tax=Amphimedon queenslandica TaxID=400682 RepID=A0A1X7VTJ6_AMPQE